MKPRLEYRQLHEHAPAIAQALRSLSAAARESGLDPLLLELVKLRASEINGCAFCLNMHAADALKLGEKPERIFLLAAWRETPHYTDRERAALAWTEALTLVTEDHVPDAVYEEAKRHFSDKELANLTAAIVAINGWNRIMVAFRIPPAA